MNREATQAVVCCETLRAALAKAGIPESPLPPIVEKRRREGVVWASLVRRQHDHEGFWLEEVPVERGCELGAGIRVAALTEVVAGTDGLRLVVFDTPLFEGEHGFNLIAEIATLKASAGEGVGGPACKVNCPGSSWGNESLHRIGALERQATCR